MGIGVGLFLLAVGAVLAFAVNATVAGIDIVTIGVILMVVGVVGVLLDLLLFMPRRRRVTSVAHGYPVTGTAVVGQPVVGQPVVGAPVEQRVVDERY